MLTKKKIQLITRFIAIFLLNTIAIISFMSSLFFIGAENLIAKDTAAQQANQYQQFMPTSAKLSFVGDIMLHDIQISMAEIPNHQYNYYQYNFDPYFNRIFSKIKDATLAIGNLELTLGSETSGAYSGFPHFNAPDDIIPALKHAGFDVLTTANNHAYDTDKFGAFRTIDVLDKYNIKHTGSFKSPAENDPLMLDANGICIGLIAYTYGLNGRERLLSADEKSWLVNLTDIVRIKADIAKARLNKAEVVIVSMHWGAEMQRSPAKRVQSLAQEIIDAGADIIVGSHPHVIQNRQTLNYTDQHGNTRNALILYSLGNFVSNQPWQFSDTGVIFDILLKRDQDGVIWFSTQYTPTYVARKFNNTFMILPVEETLSDKDFFDLLPSHHKSRLKKAIAETEEVLGSRSDPELYQFKPFCIAP